MDIEKKGPLHSSSWERTSSEDEIASKASHSSLRWCPLCFSHLSCRFFFPSWMVTFTCVVRCCCLLLRFVSAICTLHSHCHRVSQKLGVFLFNVLCFRGNVEVLYLKYNNGFSNHSKWYVVNIEIANKHIQCGSCMSRVKLTKKNFLFFWNLPSFSVQLQESL